MTSLPGPLTLLLLTALGKRSHIRLHAGDLALHGAMWHFKAAERVLSEEEAFAFVEAVDRLSKMRSGLGRDVREGGAGAKAKAKAYESGAEELLRVATEYAERAGEMDA